MMDKKQILITLFGLLLGIGFILFIFFSLAKYFSNSNEILPTPTPTSGRVSPNPNRPTSVPKNSLLIPTTVSKGRIDEESISVATSTRELKKIEQKLNYQKTLTLSSGELVDIVISKRGLQETPWILPVALGGINFQIPENDANYAKEQQAFRQASQVVFDWLTENGVQINKVYIRWGDKAFIQERAEQWLDQ